jgi:hypothetical protein
MTAGIIGGIIQLAVLLLPVILAALAARNTTQNQQSIRNEEIDKAIAGNDAGAVTVQLNTMLGQLQNGAGHSSGQGGKV